MRGNVGLGVGVAIGLLVGFFLIGHHEVSQCHAHGGYVVHHGQHIEVKGTTFSTGKAGSGVCILTDPVATP